jgi:hypothetical protein
MRTRRDSVTDGLHIEALSARNVHDDEEYCILLRVEVR